MIDSLDQLFLALKRTPYDQLIVQVKAAGYTTSIYDVKSNELNSILTGNGWNMDDFIDEYNKTASKGNRYRIYNITPDMFITRSHA